MTDIKTEAVTILDSDPQTGCRECGELNWHRVGCTSHHGVSNALYPVLDSERIADAELRDSIIDKALAKVRPQTGYAKATEDSICDAKCDNCEPPCRCFYAPNHEGKHDHACQFRESTDDPVQSQPPQIEAIRKALMKCEQHHLEDSGSFGTVTVYKADYEALKNAINGEQ